MLDIQGVLSESRMLSPECIHVGVGVAACVTTK